MGGDFDREASAGPPKPTRRRAVMDDRAASQGQREPVATMDRSSLWQMAGASLSRHADQKEGRLKLLRRRWLLIFVSGLVLLFLVERTLVATADPNYIPSALLLGAFLVPVTFTTYLYERLPHWDVALPAVAICFIWGGVLGTVVAGNPRDDGGRGFGVFSPPGIRGVEEGGK